MQNIHDSDKGRRVVALADRARCYGPDFPGWGAPNAADYLTPVVPGAFGEVTYVESHGMAPFTRYCVRFDDGTRASGLVAGEDFRFAG